ncbi:protein BLISTER-like [Phoenix dactylifera]|uniref:Protein BLISTER-like n=1 Tax=Phoenix dactylifera TaxID=42345 RepID=A0A8B7CBK8_PHODC|nr:protein BLISTER-like [Phoenix dactylifera]
MASAHVLPNSAASSRKGHLEAGKKRLEEFRRQKAAKKAASTGQLQPADVDQHGKHTQNSEHVRDGSVSGRDGITVTNPSGSVTSHENKTVSPSQSTDAGSSNGTSATSSSWLSSNNALYGDSEQEPARDEVSKLYGSSGFSQLDNGYYDHFRENTEFTRTKSEPTDVITGDQLISLDSLHAKPNIDEKTNHSGFLPERSESVSTHKRLGLPSTSTDTSGVRKDSFLGVEQPIRGGNMDYHSALGINTGGGQIADAISRRLNVGSAPWHASEPPSADFRLAFRSSSNQNQFPSSGYGTTFGRSRPSFLDSLGVPRVSYMPYDKPEKANPPSSFSSSNFDSTETHSSSSQKMLSAELVTIEQSYDSRTMDVNIEKEPSLTSVSNDTPLLDLGVGDQDMQEDHDMQSDHNIPILKKDEDFAALEQHIEDLTQEKFSLQRALDTSRTLAESLAAENSSLTESYNQQGKAISQLKFDMEGLQEEIKAQLLALESVKMEYANAQLECNAADERAKILASEVISLEEKALKLRSNELKLEKQLENLSSEIPSYRRKVSILEKERQDFQSTINALQEEKKVLQSKLRKASTDGKIKDSKKASPSRRDASTSTEDLGAENVNLVDGEATGPETMLNDSLNALQDISLFMSLPEDGRLYLPDGSGGIPVDQLRMIDNINTLISELALEKEEVVRALKIESSNCSKLKDLNKDLSQKLEAQTQRLELMTAQRMADENVLAKPVDSHIMHDKIEYADEGDEVVERVLGWIMKLFPGGPAKRRTSKLL